MFFLIYISKIFIYELVIANGHICISIFIIFEFAFIQNDCTPYSNIFKCTNKTFALNK